MRKVSVCLLLPLLLLAGCSRIGEKTASLSYIYAATALISLALLIVCFCIVRRKEPWFLLLFISVFVVNSGYFLLSVSQSLSFALWSNRIAYLGSVFLPFSMLMITLSVTEVKVGKRLPIILAALGILVFLIAASPGVLNIYYSGVSLVQINGVSSLNKVYGPLHFIYLIYLLGYFTAMVATIVHTTLTNKISSLAYAALLTIAVFVNIGVWMIEQLVKIDFEFLAVSYIISELFLLGLYLLMAEHEKQRKLLLDSSLSPSLPHSEEKFSAGQIDLFVAGLDSLTPKERELYDCYISGMTTEQIMEKLSIKENTLKFHNKNLYGKLGVKSRRQLTELHRIK